MKRLIGLTLGVTLLLGTAELAFARPGGGHGFSGGASRGGGGGSGNRSGGGGGYSSSGSSSSSGEIDAEVVSGLVELARLCFVYPKVGIPLIIVIGLAFAFRDRFVGSGADGFVTHRLPSGWSSGSTTEPAAPTPTVRETLSPRRTLERLREEGGDPDFSLVLFEDFLYALYARAQEARGARTLDELSPYIGPRAREVLARTGPDLLAVRTPIIGAMTYVSVTEVAPDRPQVVVRVEFEANYTAVRGTAEASEEQAYYVCERWMLVRKLGVRSRPPERTRVFGCPSCGAPLTELRGDTCGHCGKVVVTGAFDWLVEAVNIVRRERSGPQLVGNVAEQGTQLPLVRDPSASARLEELKQRDPAFAWEAFEARVRLVFSEFQTGWSAREAARFRPYLSDNLFQAQVYWVEAYLGAKLTNVSEASLQAIALARVSSDKYYDAISVRVKGKGLDYTVNASGEVVGGSRATPRTYTEYWTLIRGAGARGAARADKLCPSCGAPLAINMAGSCEYCSARVVSGEFDWVLSRIEQDEVYQG
jgi:predicted lipid-binding transport protein (Tim44 family)